jgi:hypothetical protein
VAEKLSLPKNIQKTCNFREIITFRFGKAFLMRISPNYSQSFQDFSATGKRIRLPYIVGQIILKNNLVHQHSGFRGYPA